MERFTNAFNWIRGATDQPDGVYSYAVPPSVEWLNINRTQPNKVELSCDRKFFDYTENDVMNFTCTSIGGIPHNISLSIDDVLYKSADLMQTINYSEKASWARNGKSISCIAYHSELAIPLERSKQLAVSYAPQFEKGVNGILTLQIEPGLPKNVSVVIRANPTLDLERVIWAMNGGKLDEDVFRPWKIETSKDSWILGLEIHRMPVANMRVELKLANAVGETMLQLLLEKKDYAADDGNAQTILAVSLPSILLVGVIVTLVWVCYIARTGKIKIGNVKTPILRKRVFNIRSATLHYSYTYKDSLHKTMIDETKKFKFDAWSSNFEFPSPKLLKELTEKTERKEETGYNEEWILIYCAQGKFLGIFNGLYGQVYFNRVKRQVVLAFRSTITADCPSISWLCHLAMRVAEFDVNAACTLGESVKQFISEFDEPIQVLVTGNSLGGYLAQVVTHTMKKFHLKNGLLKTTSERTVRPTAFVFNAPPCLRRLEVIDETAPLMDIVTTPVFNFIRDVGLVDRYITLGGHLGTLIFVGDSDLHNMSAWKLMDVAGTYNIKREHVEKNFCPEKLRSRLSSVTSFDEKVISWTNFDEDELELLNPQQKVNDAPFEMPKFHWNDGRIEIESEHFLQFIPKLKLLFQAMDTTSPRFLIKMFENSCQNNYLKFSDEMLKDIGEHLNANILYFQSSWEKLTFAQTLRNSTENVFVVDRKRFLNFEFKDKWFQSLVGTLLILAKDDVELLSEHPLAPKSLKIIYLCNAAQASETTFKPLLLADLDKSSREMIKNTKVPFAGKLVEAQQVFEENLIYEVSLENILNFRYEIELPADEFYIDQSIQDEKKSSFSNAATFASAIFKQSPLCVLISSNPGTGKSAAMRKIAETYHAELEGYFVHYLQFSDFAMEYVQVQGKIYRPPFNKRSVVEDLQAKLKDKVKTTNMDVLKKTFLKKLESNKVILVFDGFDAVCPKYLIEACNFLKHLKENPVRIIVATRRDYEQTLVDNLAVSREGIFKLASLEKQEEFVLGLIRSEKDTENEIAYKNIVHKFQLTGGLNELLAIPMYLKALTLDYLQSAKGDEFFKSHVLLKILVDKAVKDAAAFRFTVPSKLATTNETKEIEKLIYEIVILKEKNVSEITYARFSGVTKNRIDFMCFTEGKANILYGSFKSLILSEIAADVILTKTKGDREKQILLKILEREGCMLERQILDEILSENRGKFVNKTGALPRFKFSFDIDKAFFNVLLGDFVHLGNVVISWMDVKKTVLYSGQELTPVEWAKKLNKPAFVQMLLAKGNVKTLPIHTAAKKGKLKEVKAEIKKGVNVDSLDEHEKTPLYYAILGNNIEIVQILAKASKIDLCEYLYQTISSTEATVTVKIVEVLIKKDAELLNRPLGIEKHSPLLLAVQSRKIEVVKYLVTIGANTKVQDEFGNTCLHFAAGTGNLELVEYLVSNSGCLATTNSAGHTPRQVAQNEEKFEVENFLMEKEDECNTESEP